MYEELVGDLRYCDKGDCNGCRRYTKETRFCNALLREAADAIEELSMKLHGDEAAIAGMKREIERMVVAGNPRWVSVTERLPEENCQVLAYYGFNRGDGDLGMMFMQVLDYYARDPKPHFQHEGLNGMTVTHWMQLPEPPEEEA